MLKMPSWASSLCILWILAAAAVNETRSQGVNLPGNLKEISDQIKTSAAKVDWTPGIGDWVPSVEMSKELRYYIAGYDYSKRPVVIWEAGHWDAKKYVTNPATKDDFYKYNEQFWFRLHNLTSPHKDAEDGIVLVFDSEGWPASQLTSIETIKFHLWSSRIGEKYETHIVDYILINLNFVGRTWVNVIRPIAGKLVGKMESYGPKKESWLAVLKSKMPSDQIPSWYGGSAVDYKPVQVWG